MSTKDEFVLDDNHPQAQNRSPRRCAQLMKDTERKRWVRCQNTYNPMKWWQRWSRRCALHSVRPKTPNKPSDWENTERGALPGRCMARRGDGLGICHQPALRGRRFCWWHAGRDEEQSLFDNPDTELPSLLDFPEYLGPDGRGR